MFIVTFRRLKKAGNHPLAAASPIPHLHFIRPGEMNVFVSGTRIITVAHKSAYFYLRTIRISPARRLVRVAKPLKKALVTLSCSRRYRVTLVVVAYGKSIMDNFFFLIIHDFVYFWLVKKKKYSIHAIKLSKVQRSK